MQESKKIAEGKAPDECLFSQEHVKIIKEQYEDWFNNSLREADRETEGKYFTHSGIPVKLIYTPADVEHINYLGRHRFFRASALRAGRISEYVSRTSVHPAPVGRSGGTRGLQREGLLSS
jgi:hypothetical protein